MQQIISDPPFKLSDVAAFSLVTQDCPIQSQSLLVSQIFAQNLYSDCGAHTFCDPQLWVLFSDTSNQYTSAFYYIRLLSDWEKHTFKGATNLQVSHDKSLLPLYLSLFPVGSFFLQFMHSFSGQSRMRAQLIKPTGALFHNFFPKHSAVLTILNSVLCHFNLERIWFKALELREVRNTLRLKKPKKPQS